MCRYVTSWRLNRGAAQYCIVKIMPFCPAVLPPLSQALASLACLRSLTLVVNQDDPMARVGVHCLPPSLSSLTLQVSGGMRERDELKGTTGAVTRAVGRQGGLWGGKEPWDCKE